MTSVDKLMVQAVTQDVFPGGHLLVSNDGNILFNKTYGLANIYTGKAVTKNTLFDLASLTKPLATALAVMLLIQDGKLCLDQPVASIIPELRQTSKAKIQIRHLLSHTSGLPDFRPFYLSIRELPFDRRKKTFRRCLVDEPMISAIDEKTVYSDIGFMLLEWVIELLSNMHLNDFAKEKIYDLMGIEDLFFNRHDRLVKKRNYAATEWCPWRQMVLSGQVHDDNAYVMGGVAGHAGLFGTAEAVHSMLLELLKTFHAIPAHAIFQPGIVRLFFQKSLVNDRALGFDGPSPTGSSCGDRFNRKTTVGHLGFTGTSFWMDLEQRIIVILLTNRVHPSRKNERIKEFRPLIHNQVMKQFGG